MASELPSGAPYTDIDSLARQSGLGGAPPPSPRRDWTRLPGTSGNPKLIAAAMAVFALSAVFLAIGVGDLIRGRSIFDRLFDDSAHVASGGETRAAVARDFSGAAFAEQVQRLRSFVPEGASITALSLNSGRRLSAIVPRGSSALVYEADALHVVPQPWISHSRRSAPPLALADLDPAAPARIVAAVSTRPGFTPDGMSSLTLARDPRLDGALRWTATWAFDRHAIFTAAADGRQVRRELRAAGAPS